MFSFIVKFVIRVGYFSLANTHLYFKPDADHIRLLQTITCLRYLEKKLELVKSKYLGNSVGVIFCGDFNCTPPFGCYRLATGGKITEDDEDWTSRRKIRKYCHISSF